MVNIPPLVERWVQNFAGAARKATYFRLCLLTLAAILTTGRRTVSNLVRTLQVLMPGHPSTYHRIFSKRKWSAWKLGKSLARLIVSTWCAGVIDLVGDDTVDEHPGRKVYGKDKHRDAVRSSKSYTAWRWGHKWVVLSILVQFPFAKRRWALPVFVALYRSKAWNKRHGRRHKTPQQIMQGLVLAMLHLFPNRRFRFTGDSAFGTHEFATLASRQQGRLTLISRFYGNASLHRPTPKSAAVKKKPGRPRLVGERLGTPQDVALKTKRRKHFKVRWYGGGEREVSVVVGKGLWYIRGKQPVAVLWILVHDCTGTHRDDYFFATDDTMSVKDLIECYTDRWSIEVTFEEMRAYVGLESTRCRTENAVLREAPWLFGIFSLTCLLFASLPAGRNAKLAVNWVGKSDVTFADAITGVRRWLWRHWVFVEVDKRGEFAKLSRKLQDFVLNSMAHAA